MTAPAAAVILAGGRGRRLGGIESAFPVNLIQLLRLGVVRLEVAILQRPLRLHAADGPVIVDERLQRLGQIEYLSDPIHLHVRPVPLAGEHAHAEAEVHCRYPRVLPTIEHKSPHVCTAPPLSIVQI